MAAGPDRSEWTGGWIGFGDSVGWDFRLEEADGVVEVVRCTKNWET
jgi:hypothetical protein